MELSFSSHELREAAYDEPKLALLMGAKAASSFMSTLSDLRAAKNFSELPASLFLWREVENQVFAVFSLTKDAELHVLPIAQENSENGRMHAHRVVVAALVGDWEDF